MSAIPASLPSPEIQRELEYSAFNRDEKFASQFLGVSVDCLRTWRRLGRGPETRKLNGYSIRYSIKSLQSWVDLQQRGGCAGA